MPSIAGTGVPLTGLDAGVLLHRELELPVEFCLTAREALQGDPAADISAG